MTYQKLLYLKYKIGVSTYELVQRFPEQIDRVSEIAMLDIPEEILKEILKEEKAYNKLIRLKRRFANFFRSSQSSTTPS